MKYSKNFERDFNWFLKNSKMFNFDGSLEYYNKKGQNIVVFDSKGVSGKEAFYLYDSQGIVKPTRHPNLLYSLLKVKGSVNLHIKMYAEDLAKHNWNRLELRALCIKLKAPSWFREAIENQRWKLVFN